MKIINIKRNAGDTQLDGSGEPAYEITYRKDSNSEVKPVSIPESSVRGQEIKESFIQYNRQNITQDELEKVVVNAVEDYTSIVLEKQLDSMAKESETGEAISARIRLVNGAVLMIDENELTGPLAEQLLAMVFSRRENPNSVKTEDWLSLVNFAEALYDNVDEYIREQLYTWLTYQVKNGRLTLTPEGKFLGYKGCKIVDDKIVSINSGPGFVNGVYQDGHLDNTPGNVLEMARGEVDNNPNKHCSVGLHVGSFDYAKDFGQGALVLVEVDPRDVVSVPNDYNGQKIRACKYKVIKEVDSELTEFSVNFETKPLDEIIDEVLEVEETEQVTLVNVEDFKENDVVDIVTFDGQSYEGYTITSISDGIIFTSKDKSYHNFLIKEIESIDLAKEEVTYDFDYNVGDVVDILSERIMYPKRTIIEITDKDVTVSHEKGFNRFEFALIDDIYLYGLEPKKVNEVEEEEFSLSDLVHGDSITFLDKFSGEIINGIVEKNTDSKILIKIDSKYRLFKHSNISIPLVEEEAESVPKSNAVPTRELTVDDLSVGERFTNLVFHDKVPFEYSQSEIFTVIGKTKRVLIVKDIKGNEFYLDINNIKSFTK